MDKMKEFLLKNKGCPMTPAATKQLLVKFIEWLQEQGYGELDANKINELIDVFTNTVDIIFVYYEGDFIKFSKSLPSNFTGNTLEISPGNIDNCYYENGEYISGSSFSLDGVTKIDARSGTPVTVYGKDSQGKLVIGKPIDITNIPNGIIKYRLGFDTQNNLVKEEISNGFNVRISFTSTIYNENAKNYFRIYDGQDNTGTLLFENLPGTTLANLNVDITCTTGFLSFYVDGPAISYSGTATTGISPSPFESYNLSYFTITSDGTITITFIDFDD